MAGEIILQKEKIVAEDIVLSTESSVTQTRNGATFIGTPVNSEHIPYSPTQTTKAALQDRYTKAESDTLITDNTTEIASILAELRSFYLGKFADRTAVENYITTENIQLTGGESYWDIALSLFYVWNDADVLWKNIPLTMDGTTNTGNIAAITGTDVYTIPNGFTGTALIIHVDGAFKTGDVDYTANASTGQVTFINPVTTGQTIQYFAFTALTVVEYPSITVTDDPLSLPASPKVGDIAWLHGASGAEAMVTYTLPDQTGKDNQFLISVGGVAQWSDMITQDVADVAAIKADVTTVAGISSDVTDVAGIKTDVTAVNTEPLKSAILGAEGYSTDIYTATANMSSVTAEALRQANRDKYFSGFVHMGKHYSNTASFPNVNQGIYTVPSVPNEFVMGCSGTTLLGDSKEDYPHLNVNGSILKLYGINYLNDPNPNKILLPSAPNVTHADSSNSGLVLNGKFDTDTVWTKTGTATIAGGVLSLPTALDTGYQTFSVIVGKTYVIELEQSLVDAFAFLHLGSTLLGTEYYSSYLTDNRTELEFTATTTLLSIKLGLGASGVGCSFKDIAVMPKDEISRKDLSFLEVWHEDITEKDFVYPLGNVQYLGADTDGLTGIANGAFTGFGTYSLFGNWQASSALIGKGYVWSTMNILERIAFVSNPANGVEFDGDTPVQRRYRMRVVQGLGDEWNESSLTVFEGVGTFGTYGSHVVQARGKNTVLPTNDLETAYTNRWLQQGHASGVIEADIGAFGLADSGIAIAYEGKCYALPIALIHRRNQGGHHPVFNPNGTTRYWVDEVGGTGEWYHSSVSMRNISDTFTFSLSNSGSATGRPVLRLTGAGGSIAEGYDGRADGLFYDQIHEGDITDLRSDANGITDKTRFTFDELGNAISGDTRGSEGEWEVVKQDRGIGDSSYYYFNPDEAVVYDNNDNYLGRKAHIGSVCIIVNGTDVAVMKHTGVFQGDEIRWQRQSGTLVGVSGVVAVTSSIFVYGATLSTRTKSNTLTHTDIIGDPANYYRGQTYTNTGASQIVDVLVGNVVWNRDGNDVNGLNGHFYECVSQLLSHDISLSNFTNTGDWTDLGTDWDGAGSWRKDGVAGTPLLVGENGEDYIPDGTSSTYKLSKKLGVYKKFVYSLDNGVTWVDTWNPTISATTNDYVATHPIGLIAKLTYTTHTEMTEPAVNSEVLAIGDAEFINTSIPTFGASIAQSLINKVPVNGSTNDGHTVVSNIERYQLTSSLVFNQGTDVSPTHTPISVSTASNPAVKLFPYLTRENGRAYINIPFKEMKHDSTQDIVQYIDAGIAFSGIKGETFILRDFTNSGINGITIELKIDYATTWASTVLDGYYVLGGDIINSAGDIWSVAKVWDGNGFGDDNKFNIVNGVSTTTDDNGNTVLIGVKRIPTNKFIADKE